jgi:NADH-quinone oxidoreductase subunit M
MDFQIIVRGLVEFFSQPLNILIFLPILGAILVSFIGRPDGSNATVLKRLAIGLTAIEFLISLPLALRFQPNAGMQFDYSVPWMWTGGLNVFYHVGLDGISLWLLVLTTLIVPIALLSSYDSITRYVREYLALVLMLEAGMVGVFVALDMFLFYLFFEVMLIPMYFIIGIWGGERRIYAALKFVLYTMFGSLLMLVAIIAVYILHGQLAGTYTFDIPTITASVASGRLVFDRTTELLLFGAFALAFFIKVPLFPFHTWLPDAHVEAPTAGSVILASVLLKIGVYGLLRFNLPMFPNASIELAPVVGVLAVIGIIYGALVAMVQPDIKKLIAYSSVSHMGFCVLGIFSFTSIGLQGSLVQMLAHGLSTGALFLLVGIIYDRRHTRLISEFGGLATPMPRYAFVFLVTLFASIGLPLLCGFPGEFLVLTGTFTATRLPSAHAFAALAATAMVWGAVYMLWMYQRVVMGDITKPENEHLPDLTRRELTVLVPLVVLMIVMGVYPSLFTDRSQPALNAVLIGPLEPAPDGPEDVVAPPRRAAVSETPR